MYDGGLPFVACGILHVRNGRKKKSQFSEGVAKQLK